MELAGKTFLVTGGKSGLGEATAIELARAGAQVEILDLPEVDVTDEDAVGGGRRSLPASTRCTAPSTARASAAPHASRSSISASFGA